MPYGTIKIDTITFTDGGVDKSVPVSGLILNPTFTGNVTVTGTISGNIIQGGTTVSGLTVTGTTANFASGVFTTQISGVTITGTTVAATTGTFTSLTGTTTNGTTASFTTGNFTSLTGTTTTGTIANFASGVFTTQVSGLLITGPTVSATTGNFTSLTGTTTTGTTANFASGVFTTQISGVTITGTTISTTTGNFTSLTGTTATITSGIIASGTAALPSLAILSDPNTGIYSPGADQLAVATNGTQRLTVDTAATTSTLPVVHPLGAVGTPSLTFTGDLNTGIFSPGADQVAISTNGTSRLSIDASGNIAVDTDTLYVDAVSNRVGVGTASPAQLLHVSGSGTQAIRLENTLGTGNVNLELKLTNNTFTTGLNNTSILYNDTAGREYIWYQNSAERLRITSAGLVGIGTSSPQAELNVAKTGSAATVYIESDAGNNATTSILRFGGASGRSASIQGFRGASSNVHSLDFYTYNSADTFGMRLTPTGLGIGTTSPQSLLNISTASIAGDQNVLICGTAATGVTGSHALYLGAYGSTQYGCKIKSIYNYAASVSTQLSFEISNAGTLTEAARIDSSGRLLVGTSSARSNFFNTTQSANIQLEGTTGTALMSLVSNANNTGGNAALILGKTRGTTVGSTTVVQSGDVIGRITFQGSDGTEFVQAADIYAEVDGTPGADDMPGRLVFSTTADEASSPTERMRINSVGNVLCNTTSAGSAGGVNGQHTFSHSISSQWSTIVQHTVAAGNVAFGLAVKYTAATPNNTSSEFLYCEDATAIRAAIRSNGGLVNYSANNANLSDRNAKKDISPAAGTWDCIKEWEIVNYRYKDQPDNADLNLGVIAQQVAESCPEVITIFEEAKDDQPEKLGIKEQQMYWMAIKALQEAQVRIEALEAEVAALKAQ